MTDSRVFMRRDMAMTMETDGVGDVYAVTDASKVFENGIGQMARTNIATHHFNSYERLIIAISDDDVTTMDKMAIPLEDLARIEFDGGANVLNLAID